MRHTNYRTFEKHIRPYLRDSGVEELETICLVREPVSWLSSWYRFRSRHELRDPGHPNHRNSTHGMTFDEFVSAYMADPVADFADVGTQTAFVKDSAGQVGMQRLFAYDQMSEFVRYMGAKIGAEMKLGHKNVSPSSAQASDIAERLSSLKRRFMRRMDRRRSADQIEVAGSKHPLAEEQLHRLRQHIAADFDLYDQASQRR